MSDKQFLALPVTGDTFAVVREKNRYYVDKTPYLKLIFSEDEACDGYADIAFKSEYSENAVIIEIKAAPVGSDLIPLCKSAIAQIEEKNYA